MAPATDDWLDEFNAAAHLAQVGRFHDALVILNDLAPRLSKEPTLTPKFHIMFELRRADLCDKIGDRNESLRRFSAAMQIAYEQSQDEVEVCHVYRRLLDTIQGWQDWNLLLKTGKQLCSLAQNRSFRLATMEAGYHMPYAYLGVGEVQRAREYAGVILERMRELDCREEIEHWTEFIRRTDSQSS